MILVLGATGFLGKRVCQKLEMQGIPYLKTSLSLGLDLRDKRKTIDFFKQHQPKYVLNCAAYVGGIQFGYKHPAELFTHNLEMTVSILEAAKQVSIKRIVSPIPNCVYPAKATFFKENEFWEGELHESIRVYGIVRKVSCIGAWAFQKQYGLDVINLVLSNMYGPEDHFDAERSHALGALIMKFVEAKEKHLPYVEVWGSGKPVREWLHVDDGAEAMLRGLHMDPYVDPINIGIGKGISVLELAEKIKHSVGYEGEIQLNLSKPDGAAYKTVDGSLGKQLLQWQPEMDLDQGIQDTIQWYMRNRR